MINVVKQESNSIYVDIEMYKFQKSSLQTCTWQISQGSSVSTVFFFNDCNLCRGGKSQKELHLRYITYINPTQKIWVKSHRILKEHIQTSLKIFASSDLRPAWIVPAINVKVIESRFKTNVIWVLRRISKKAKYARASYKRQ